jgi:hypothetical protein
MVLMVVPGHGGDDNSGGGSRGGGGEVPTVEKERGSDGNSWAR